MSILKALGASFILALTTPVGMAQSSPNPTADSIRYFLVNAVERPAIVNPNGCREPKMIGIGLQSQSANVYCPGKATVITTFEIEGTYAVMFKTDSTTFWVVSDLKDVQLKKGETVERGAFIGEAAWNEDTQNYECDLLLNLKKTNANREKMEEYLNRMK
ncbi:hypothetical protein [Pseudobacter ginsenosidimutans]|nr:hypothetical protein [Pseudobacter ginsenosidimutans]QEC45386.1 hypothetical protein FSB84_28215 [Pseudobacter ginsenosidimutans]